MKTVTINRSKIRSEWQAHVTRDVTSGIPYQVTGTYAAGDYKPNGVEASQDSVGFIDDAGDTVYVWVDAPGITVQEVSE